MKMVKCYVCGKEYLLAPYNIYKLTVDGRIRRTCSWSCLRELERQVEASKKRREE